MKDKRLVAMTASELEAMFSAHCEQFGYDQARDWLYDYAPTVKLTEGAIGWYRMVMAAY